MRKRTKAAPVIALAIALIMALLAACGSGTGGGATTAATTAAATTAAATTAAAATEAAATEADAKEEAATEAATTAAATTAAATEAKADETPAGGGELSYPIGGMSAEGYPMGEEGFLTLTVWQEFTSTIITDRSENEMFKEMEKATGVKINWIHPPAGQREEHYNLLIATNDLPDIFYNPPLYTGGVMKAVDDDIYLDLTPMIEEYAPNFLRAIKLNQQVEKEARQDDGRILSLGQVQLAHEAPWYGPFIRTDVLDAVNMPVPETVEEWYETMLAFKDYGIQIPFGQQDGGIIKNEFGLISGAYGTAPALLNKDGTVVYGFIEDQYRDFLAEMNKWYAEGLYDPDFDTRNYDSLKAEFAAGNMGVVTEGYGDANVWILSGQANNPDFMIVAAPYPVMNKGDDPSKTLHIRQENYMVRGQPSFITTDCKTPELALRWLDFFYTVPGFLLKNYGPYGVSWDWADGEDTPENTRYFPPELIGIGKHPAFTEFMTNNPDGTEFWILVQKYKIHNHTGIRNPNAYVIQEVAKESMDIWTPPGSDWFMPQIAYSIDEQARRGQIVTDVETYRNQMIYSFVKGSEPLSKWGEYVETMNKLGAQEIISMAQDALGRYQNR